jgi:hypothetical protein
MKTFTTPKGTALPIQKLKGKDYLLVAHRLVWFREERPEWKIETEFLQLNPTLAIAKATIKNQAGEIMSTAHKREDKNDFPDYAEKAETGAIGRALAYVGFGTQFCADELDEGKRIVDAPIGEEKESDPPKSNGGFQGSKKPEPKKTASGFKNGNGFGQSTQKKIGENEVSFPSSWDDFDQTTGQE